MNDKQREEYVRADETLRAKWLAKGGTMRTFLRSERSMIDSYISAQPTPRLLEDNHEQTSGN